MARARPREPVPVTWRDGIHLSGTPIWCDALRARDVCFVSCAHALGNARHGQLIATAPTLALLAAHTPQTSGTQLPVTYGRPFSLGTVRLELIPSGHGLGSAGLVADVTGRRVLHAGTVNPHGGGLGGVAGIRQCDALVVAAGYGDPRFRFPSVDETVAHVAAFAAEVTSSGGTAILLVSSASKALDVASRLTTALATSAPGAAFLGHRAFHAAARKLRASHPDLPRIRRWQGTLPAGHVLLWPAHRRDTLPAPVPAPSRVALVSGQALDPDAVASLRVDAAFAWSNQADHDELVRYIETSAARQVYVTHRFAEALAARLTGGTRVVRALGPPRQMSLL